MPAVKQSTGTLSTEQFLSLTPSQRKQWFLADFQIGSLLGRGRFGSVFVVKDKETENVFAMKMIVKATVEEMNMKHQLRREVEIHYHLNHENIIRLYAQFQDSKNVYLIMEFADAANLFIVIRNQKRLSPHRSAFVADRVADALAYCHERGVIHRDVKPENILLASPFIPKLADFGWCVHAPSASRTTVCGTPDYVAPEMITNATYVPMAPHDHKVDCWAVGVLLYEMLVGKAPFEDKDSRKTFQRIIHGEISESHLALLPQGAANAITSLLKREPNDRPELEEWRKNDWLRDQVKVWQSKSVS